MAMRFLQETEITLESILALEALNFPLHKGDVGRELKVGTIMEMYAVIRFTFDKFYTFVF